MLVVVEFEVEEELVDNVVDVVNVLVDVVVVELHDSLTPVEMFTISMMALAYLT